MRLREIKQGLIINDNPVLDCSGNRRLIIRMINQTKTIPS